MAKRPISALYLENIRERFGRNKNTRSALSVFSFGDISVDINNKKKYRKKEFIDRIAKIGELDISILL